MITRFEVDGVPALFSQATGPMRAGLAFRVGTADETLPKHGITHLLEHLALFSAGVADYHYNGATGPERTYFHTQGTEEEIVGFLNGVCASLTDLPLGRLAAEKEILRTEASSRRFGANNAMGLWRHGARDYGLTSYPEWGLAGITPDDLRAWAARYFVRQNAVLWVSGPEIPAGLKLVLPDGERRPAPTPSSALPATPAFYPGGDGAVVWDSTVRREPAVAIFAGVLERVLMRSLRQEQGLSYTVQTDYELRDDDSVVLTALADATAEKQSAVLGGFVDVLAAMRIGRIDPADVTAVINRAVSALEQADDKGGRLVGQAFNVLAGRPVRGLEEMIEETRGVTHADVVRVAATAYANGLLQTPEGSSADWAGYTAAPTSSEQLITGQEYLSPNSASAAAIAAAAAAGTAPPKRNRIIIGPEGVSHAIGEEIATVRFDACAAMLCWPDGARQVIGLDAISVAVEPTLYVGLPAAISWLDAQVPAHLRVEMPARDPKRIPQPPKPAARPFTVASVRRRRLRPSQIRLIVMLLVAVAWVVMVEMNKIGG
jgi:zinc protease